MATLIPSGKLVTPVAFDPSGNILPFQVDASGRQIVTSQPGIASRGIGIGSVASNTALAAGSNTINQPNVPASTVYVVKWCSMYYVGTITTVKLRLQMVIGGVAYTLFDYTPTASGFVSGVALDFPLQAGDNIRLVVSNATLNDSAFLYSLSEKLS